MEYNLKPIAKIYTDFDEKFGIPRQSGRVSSLTGKIVFEPEFRSPEAIRGLEAFNYIWLIFDFSLSHRPTFSPTVRPPRLGGNKRTGVFATRSPFRPNNLGLSSVKLDRIEQTDEGLCLIVSGIDILNETPIFDIKPYIPYSDCHTDATEGFTENTKNHFLNVEFPQELLDVIPKEKREAIVDCLADDPRPSYIEDGKIFRMKFSSFDIEFHVYGNNLTVTDVTPLR